MHATIGDWGGMAFQDLMDGVDSLVARGIADPDRLGIGGWSNGGVINEGGSTHPTAVQGGGGPGGDPHLFRLFGNRPPLQPGPLPNFFWGPPPQLPPFLR